MKEYYIQGQGDRDWLFILMIIPTIHSDYAYTLKKKFIEMEAYQFIKYIQKEINEKRIISSNYENGVYHLSLSNSILK